MNEIYVSKTGLITSINQALQIISSLATSSEPTTILIDEGVYFEKICVRLDNIILKGRCKENTCICFNDFSEKIFQNNVSYNTFRTYTMQILGNNITLENITIENACCESQKFHQAVALHLIGDKISIKNCNIYSGQDTIFSGPLPDDLVIRYTNLLSDEERVAKTTRHFFDKCHIKGDVDFIFGSGNALFNNCLIECINEKGFVAAPSTSENQKYGLTFLNCQIKGNQKGTFYLARPWRDYGKATFINCLLDSCINKTVFDKWNTTNRDKTCRFSYHNIISSKNNNIPQWVKKLSTREIEDYSIEKIFDGWIPQ